MDLHGSRWGSMVVSSEHGNAPVESTKDGYLQTAGLFRRTFLRGVILSLTTQDDGTLLANSSS